MATVDFSMRVDCGADLPLATAAAPLPNINSYANKPYRGGNLTPTNQNWQPQNWSADQAINQVQPLLDNRNRDSQRNDPAFLSAEQALVDNIIGQGISITPAVVLGNPWDDEAEENDEFNDEAASRFTEWAEEEFSADGLYNFWEAQELMIRETAAVGECFLIESLNADRERHSPLQYQVFESAQLADGALGQTTRSGNFIERGIEYSAATGRPVAYYFYPEHPSDALMLRPEPLRIEASRVIHWYLPQRVRQRRGAGYFNATVQNSMDRDWLVGNVLTQAAVQAMFTIIHKRGSGVGGLGLSAETTQDGRTGIRLGRGTVSEIDAEDAIETVQSSTPSPTLEGFIKLLMQLQSMGSRMSYLALSRDYSQVNYSSGKAAIEADNKTFRPFQRKFVHRTVKPIYNRFLDLSAGIGRFASVSPVVYRSGKRRWQQFSFTLPGYSSLDELKDATAAIARMGSGQSTLQEELIKRGLPATAWKRFIRQREKEVRMAVEASERAGAAIFSSGVLQFLGKDLNDPTNAGRGATFDTSEEAA